MAVNLSTAMRDGERWNTVVDTLGGATAQHLQSGATNIRIPPNNFNRVGRARLLMLNESGATITLANMALRGTDIKDPTLGTALADDVTTYLSAPFPATLANNELWAVDIDPSCPYDRVYLYGTLSTANRTLQSRIYRDA